MASKIPADVLKSAITRMLAFSKGEEIPYRHKEGETVKETKAGKQRKFVETIEMQAVIKGFDKKKDKKVNGTVTMVAAPRPNMKLCVLGTEKHVGDAKELGVDYRSVPDLKKMNKNKKLIKKMAKSYDMFLASQPVITQLTRLIGTGLNKAGKFPTVIPNADTVENKVNEAKLTVKYQMKKGNTINVAVANVAMTQEDIEANVLKGANFLASQLRKGWQNIKVLIIKSTMGPPFSIYF